ncbi:uncharacterized protein DNG_10500 [Cephalotrichum gorgonifer]|uniref:Uncharacterized protein n=1 Tax=Cephalotrichum gorgonifer TaxID=2041049 RepID=A0AAE8N7Q9_9PEZI|nr:uncharacterized protein DNG_10500 [Cephalotrichum gorgonifer]
MITNSIQFRPP